jgi:hypothetical protein
VNKTKQGLSRHLPVARQACDAITVGAKLAI